MSVNIRLTQVWLPLWLRDYAADYGDQRIEVWVNPPLALINERHEIVDAVMQRAIALARERAAESGAQAEGLEDAYQQALALLPEALDENERADLDARLWDWLARVWRQDGESLDGAAIAAFAAECADTDPALMAWLSERTMEMIRAWRNGQKKNWTMN